MTANVETMMYQGQKPWHGLGVQVEGSINSAEAIKQAGLDWEVALTQLQTANGTIIPDTFGVQRSTDNSVLGIVGNQYTPLQNRDAFGFFDPIVSAGEANYETAGSLKQGARVWILAKLNREPSVIVPQSNDIVEKFILLSNSHDGKMAVRVGFTPIRVVCQNTLAHAHAASSSRLIRVTHGMQVRQNVESLRETMNLANQEFEATADKYRALASKQINSKDLLKYVKQVLGREEPITVDTDYAAPEAKGKVENRIIELFETGAGNNMEGVAGTTWAAYNAVTDYLSHERGNDEQNRIHSLWFNGSKQVSERALQYAYNYAVAA